MLSSFPLSILLLAIGAAVVGGYEFDRDFDSDLCRRETHADPTICTSNSTAWFSCPISCAALRSRPRGTMAEERSDPERFFELRGRRAEASGSGGGGGEISLEENEGYITMFAVLPMLPGLAEYYCEAVEHIARVYKYTVVAMILPYGDGSPLGAATLRSIRGSRRDDDVHGRAKSILLEGYDAQQQRQQQQQGSTKTTRHDDILEYLRTRNVVAGSLGIDPDDRSDSNRDGDAGPNIGAAERDLLLTRPNIFLVSHTGMFIERMLSPTMETIERRIKVHELNMGDELRFLL